MQENMRPLYNKIFTQIKKIKMLKALIRPIFTYTADNDLDKRIKEDKLELLRNK